MDFATRFAPFEPHLKKTKKVSGRKITFVDWVRYIVRAHTVDFPDGFSVRVKSVQEVGGVHDIVNDGGEVEQQDSRQCVVVMAVEDNATGCVMEATGTAPISKTKVNWGGALAEAESQALRRAFAKWGVGLEMYLDEDGYEAAVAAAETAQTKAEMDTAAEVTPEPTPPTDEQIQQIKTLMWVLDETQVPGVDDDIAVEGLRLKQGARSYVKKKGNYGKVYDKLLPQLRNAMVKAGILPVTDIQFANALDALDLEAVNPAAQALIDKEQ